jgi:hypothetical protein
MLQMFPRLFSFRDTGVLFIEHSSQCLYSINSLDYEKTAEELGEDNIVRFPTEIGLTG